MLDGVVSRFTSLGIGSIGKLEQALGWYKDFLPQFASIWRKSWGDDPLSYYDLASTLNFLCYILLAERNSKSDAVDYLRTHVAFSLGKEKEVADSIINIYMDS